MRPLLHVTNGDSAADTLRQTTLGGEVLAWQDALHEGPVRALPRSELLFERACFLAECGFGSEAALRSTLERRDRQLLDALGNGSEVVLWFEHDLYDQLQLIDVLTLAHSVDATPELIVVGSFPGKPSFTGLGELTAAELETLWPLRVRASPEAIATAVVAWAALCESEPSSLRELAGREYADLPFLAAALRRLLDELPAPTGGLSKTERFALEAIAAGARTAPAAFVASQRREDAPFLGDTWFFRTLSALAHAENRLVEGDRELRITDAGERVLRGEANRIELLGIDRWIGGTHITSG